MSRAGAERKPPWRDVPRGVRDEVERVLGSRVARAARVYGGYGPSATFRMRLADGRRVFLKGVSAASNDYMRWALGQEERVYTRIAGLISPWAPAFNGSVRHRDWHVLLLEDLGPANVPPWTRARTRVAMRSFAEFHEATIGDPMPRWLPRHRLWARFAHGWRQLARERGALAHAAALARGRQAEARRWLERALPRLRAAAERLASAPRPFAILHLDTRSDNLRLQGDLLRIFDWPNACVGPHEFDVAQFALDPALEGGPSCEEAVAAYRERVPLRDAVLDASVAAIAGFFASRAWQPPVPGLPRLRSIQRRALRVSLAWAARQLELPEPAWLAAVRP